MLRFCVRRLRLSVLSHALVPSCTVVELQLAPFARALVAMHPLALLLASTTAYKVEVIDRCVTGKPLITGSSIPGYPYVLNPACVGEPAVGD